jgi:hypothetical protein
MVIDADQTMKTARDRAGRVQMTGEPVLAPPPTLRRRPLLVAGSVLAVCAGALLGAFVWTAMSDTHSVIAVRAGIERGAVIDEADLMSVQVGVDPALSPVGSDEMADLVGQRAAVDMAAGTLVTREQVTVAVLPPAGSSIVGVPVPPGLLPGEPLVAGDRIRVVATPGAQGEFTNEPPVTIPAVVVGVRAQVDTGVSVVSVEVPQDRAAELAARAATGNVAVVLDSRER